MESTERSAPGESVSAARVTLPSQADVVVVGGGIMGASALYYLTKLGCESALLLERGTLACGSTSKAAGGIRAQFSDELNVRIALECIRRFERFEEEPGGEIDYKQWGYLFLLDGEADAVAFQRSLDVQQSLGVPSRWLEPPEAAEIVPGIIVDDLVGATFCPIDGYATPEAAVQGYARAAADAGALIVQGAVVERVLAEGGRVNGIQTADGVVGTERVILCAGVWSRDLAASAGVEIPVEPEKRYIWFTGPDPLVHELPLTIDFGSGFYLHREGDGVLFGGREQTLEDIAPVAAARLPAMAELSVRGGWWGLYENSPDHNAVVGQVADPLGLLYATGFSGHGFQQGPVIGEHLAELALGLAPTFDLKPFGIERFASGVPRAELNVV